jgi:23S rRNA (uracil1939-C5)-methyltransferase
MNPESGAMDLAARLTIDRLGDRGEGQAKGPHGAIFVPYALAGENIVAEVDGERGHLVEILTPSPDRIPAICRYYGICGGCAVQALADAPYRAWKRGLLVEALRHVDLPFETVGTLVDAHGEGRRRATFHARVAPQTGMKMDAMKVGFMQARAHELVEIDACPVLAPSMDRALPAARALANELARQAKPLDIVVTATLSGLDIDIRGCGALDHATTQWLVEVAEKMDLARVSNHGVIIIERRQPLLTMGETDVRPPPGAFLQATLAGEEILADRVAEALQNARRIGDLFAGLGTFALRLAKKAEVHAFDLDHPALSALHRAARANTSLRPVTVAKRDLFKRPLNADELKIFDALVFDPPRGGAEPQARAIAASEVPLVVYVSCYARSFARDAALLCEGGYQLESVDPIDQFRFSPHIEIVGIFRCEAKKKSRRKKLLG